MTRSKKSCQKRSTTGCRTCRARRVKCDETPGGCKRCKDSGWECEGYDFARLSNLRKEDRGIISSLTLYRVSQSLPGVGPEEKRGFAFFQHLTIPNLTGFFNTSLWTDLVLPMSHEEPAVTHALVAVSVLHEDIEVQGVPLVREDLACSRHRFALGQYGRSLAILNRRRHSQDPKFREVVLTCCYLFVAFDLMRGQYDPAMRHLKQGLAIIDEAHSGEGPEMVSTKSATIAKPLQIALTRLRDQSYFFGLNPKRSATDDQIPRSENGFSTLYDARNALDDVVRGLIVLMIEEKQLTTNDHVADRLVALFEMKRDIKRQFNQYKMKLDYSEIYTLRIQDQKDLRGLNIIRLHHLNYDLVLESVLVQDDRSLLISHVDGFRQILDLCEQIANSFQDENGSLSRPSLLLEMGVNASLFFVCWKCHDFSLRLRALKLLEEWPHREGPWDSRRLVTFAKQTLNLEFDMLASASDPQAPMRLEISSLEVREDQKENVIEYQIRGQSQEVLDQRKVVLLDEEASGDSMLSFCLRTQRYIHSSTTF
ncbi:C6 zinc finger domain protein [Aspergillus pseudocaelatus]|uniref:C6 zinc finger domain protein n=1 Tax=Aspergillus pseudocaelatus TaxID=1825620 RepID=A0ABQ6X0W6_9EURO|nr:C6 zinc finger domain protein [Aspergillus pseudocaelatus]